MLVVVGLAFLTGGGVSGLTVPATCGGGSVTSEAAAISDAPLIEDLAVDPCMARAFWNRHSM